MDPPKTTTAVQHLQLDQQATLGSLADDEVLVELHAASLSYRDIVIAKGALGELPKVVIPGSDGAGVVKAVGSKVQDLAIGERVVTHLAPTEDDDALPPSMAEISTGLGHGQNGTLREYGIFKPTALVKAPHNLDFARAATLTCSGLTAWNALFGLAGREVKKGD
ncbi:Zinc-type alcohol dehydrogenase-like protein [Fulvia fulva]|uniref:Zinc-type alcohol dehydrogenase-like protein n=1 Tax=Passalora fulva TaxID=5499 RepID=A0A9Q8LE45_PASFU|nr:Zinc-type alcohol dehydrogenase-like protein [Fulvia fulva]KAK4629640.1 Zinc-type alcohol dehydrogenase-like protein [Fulvia fulva]KAK4630564.1 Zinc-type alcohol dehydrogenase-like protein [Fulvia fulva]UJO15549.1 Zinc-type alcohol dehydrogenase-like protein [Fulvia fulva]WPV12348.1 Zinc-type alcohol dehydrogenase-like protein [Fulvia fulva]WPV27872.1 Zinc-type alcohol dehydrogenase-like protein [Fulvia fulva]